LDRSEYVFFPFSLTSIPYFPLSFSNISFQISKYKQKNEEEEMGSCIVFYKIEKKRNKKRRKKIRK
jgi:hypothetical protein